MAPYKSLAVNASDAELGGAYPEKTRSAGQRGMLRRMGAERWRAMAMPVLGSLLVLVLLWQWTHPADATVRRDSFGPPSVLRVVREAGVVPNASTVRTNALTDLSRGTDGRADSSSRPKRPQDRTSTLCDPTCAISSVSRPLSAYQTVELTLYDAVQTLDSWSGWSGQVLTAFSLLYLAHLTQRVAIMSVQHRPLFCLDTD